MSGQKDIQPRAIDEAAMRAAAERGRERQREAERFAAAHTEAMAELDRARARADEAQRQSGALAQRLAAARRELGANAAAVRDLQARSEALSRDLSQIIAQAGQGARAAREAADTAQAAVEQAQAAHRAAATEVQRAAAEQSEFDSRVLAPARRHLDEAGAALAAIQLRAQANLAVLAAMSQDATLGAIVNAMVDEADAAGLSLADALLDDKHWELQFRDADGRLFTLAAAKKVELESVKRDNRLAILVGEAPVGDEACSLTVHALLERLRTRGIAVTAQLTDPDSTGTPGRRGDKERA